MNDILADIVETKKSSVAVRKKLITIQELEKMAAGRAKRDFQKAVSGRSGVNIIAEIKKASPSAGIISGKFDPSEIAGKYSRSGAAAISVLTEEKYFKGELEYLSEARKNSDVPILRKDFLIDEYQLYEAAAYGADAALLIVSILEPQILTELIGRAREIGICPLVEIHDEKELDIAVKAGADVIGINNRNLKTLKVSLDTAARIIEKAPKDKIYVVESGIKTRKEIEMYVNKGVNSFLIGETLMRSGDIPSMIGELKNG
jgi:indole-3-glycerol phosphate synthase